MLLLVPGSRHRLEDHLPTSPQSSTAPQQSCPGWEGRLALETLVELGLIDPTLEPLILRDSLSQTSEVILDQNYTGCPKKNGGLVFGAHFEGVKWPQIKKWKKINPP